MPSQAKTTKNSDGRQEQKAIQTVNIYGFEKKKPKTKRKTKKGVKKRAPLPTQPRMQATGGFLGGPSFQAPTFFPPTYFPPKYEPPHFNAPTYVPPTAQNVGAPPAAAIDRVEEAINADVPVPELAQDVQPEVVRRRGTILEQVRNAVVGGLMGLGRAADVVDQMMEPFYPPPIQPVVPQQAEPELPPAPQEEILALPAPEEVAPPVPVIAEEAGEIVPYRERFAAGAGGTGTITLEPVPKAPKKVEVTIPEKFKGMKVTKEDLQKIPTPLVKQPISMEEMRQKRLVAVQPKVPSTGTQESYEKKQREEYENYKKQYELHKKFYKEKVKNKSYKAFSTEDLNKLKDDLPQIYGIASALGLPLTGLPKAETMIKRIKNRQIERGYEVSTPTPKKKAAKK